jgi:hypothetical protein
LFTKNQQKIKMAWMITYHLYQGFSTFSRPGVRFTFYRLTGRAARLWGQFTKTLWQFIKNAAKLALLLQTGSHFTQYISLTKPLISEIQGTAHPWLISQYQVLIYVAVMCMYPYKCSSTRCTLVLDLTFLNKQLLLLPNTDDINSVFFFWFLLNIFNHTGLRNITKMYAGCTEHIERPHVAHGLRTLDMILLASTNIIHQ